MKRIDEPTKLLGVRISADIKAVLDREAKADSRTTVSLIRKILKDYIARGKSK
jgi:predicted transcriptional regulator